jgi:hypothetical protein
MFGSKAKADCPFWRGPCKEHACRLYTQVLGMNPNTGEKINKFGCAFEFIPMLLIENSQQQRQTGASVDSLRNCVDRSNQTIPVQIAAMTSSPTLLLDQ